MSQLYSQIVSLMEDSFDDDIYRYRGYQSGSDDSLSWLTQRMGYYTTISHRAEGRYMPIYDNELDLKAIRSASWQLDAEHSTAIAIRNRLVEYTISSGFDWEITHSLKGVQKYLQAGLDKVLQASCWAKIEPETFQREIVSGEAIGYLDISEGQIVIELVESECLTEPINSAQLEDYYGIDHFLPSWSFGVLTKKNRARPLGYHFVFDEAGQDWDFMKASDVFHWKRNTSVRAKRGAPDAVHTLRWLRRAEKVLANTAIGAAIQAAIAYIVEHSSTISTEKISALAAARANNIVRKVDSIGSQYTANKIRPGQVIDIKNGGKFHSGLLGSTSSEIWIEVMDACLRFGAAPYAMPEHMVTGYAGNNNRASSETAESPFIQGRLHDQRTRGENLRVLFKQICRKLIETGGRWRWEDVEDGLTINIVLPDILNRDIGKLTDALIKQKQNGWICDRMATQELGNDYDDVKAGIDEEKRLRPEDYLTNEPAQGGGGGNPAPNDQKKTQQ